MEGIKKGFRSSSTERCLAARTAALYGISLGTESEPFFEGLKSSFEALISGSSDPLVKAEVGDLLR